MSVQVHAKGAGWGWAQGSVRASSFTPNSSNRVFINLVLCTGYCHLESEKGVSKVLQQLQHTTLSKMCWFAEALKLLILPETPEFISEQMWPNTFCISFSFTFVQRCQKAKLSQLNDHFWPLGIRFGREGALNTAVTTVSKLCEF